MYFLIIKRFDKLFHVGRKEVIDCEVFLSPCQCKEENLIQKTNKNRKEEISTG